jgi:hypothetical protein
VSAESSIGVKRASGRKAKSSSSTGDREEHIELATVKRVGGQVDNRIESAEHG